MPWRSDPEARQWIMILFGLGVGGLARWALLMRDKEFVGWKVIITDLMVMGVLGLAAKWTVGRLGIEGETTALIAALFALSSDRIVRLMLAWFLTSARKAARLPVERDYDPVDPRPVSPPEPSMTALIEDIDRNTDARA